MITQELYSAVPTWKDGSWEYTSFQSRDVFRDFITGLFKEPGKYNFNETSYIFNEEARNFRSNNKIYCFAPKNTKDYIVYWNTQKERCRKGAIYRCNDLSWYIPREYYMWLNFLPIYDKEQGKYDFASVRDAQYHLALYELLAELYYKHASLVKKRQIASSYYHGAKLVNGVWFEEGYIGKIGASLKDYINEKGTWKFLEEYRSFLNKYTAWYRPMNPGKVMMWEQKISRREGGREVSKGLMGKIQGMSFEQDPTTGVGGPCSFFFHEEGGIAPDAGTTYRYIKPALRSGKLYTGLFCIAGSVGDLDQCDPLKDFTFNPEANDIFPVDSNLIDSKGTLGRTGLFIPEQWSMPPFMDEFGNSQVDLALASLDEEFEKLKKTAKPEDYQLEVSQRPRNLEEAFAHRKLSKFPTDLITQQYRRIEDKEYGYQFVDLIYKPDGKVTSKESNKLPINEFPLSSKTVDKEGVVVVWEKPIDNPPFGTYYASIDPVSEGRTTTSDSLCSIFIMKNAVEVTRHGVDGTPEVFIEKDKIVASWCGRFDDINKTHRRLEMMIEWYNAWTVVENNISLFIQYMIAQRKQKYLVPKNQIMFLKDIGANQNVYQEYGWKNTGTIFKSHLLSYAIEYLKEEIDTKAKPDGEIVKITFGVERIPDKMLLREMLDYRDGLNVDRLVAFSALVAFAKIQQSNRGYTKRYEKPDNKLEISEKKVKLDNSPFRHLGKRSSSAQVSTKRRPFKNLK